MRSSKSRSRSKGSRNRPSGNIVNRVFDSSGPEGKVRGTPQQIIDKYNQLARDAQLANDRVATENFQQHAEHYLRMLAEAQREQAERQQQHQQQQQQNRNQNDSDDDEDDRRKGRQEAQGDQGERPERKGRGPRGKKQDQDQGGSGRSDDVIEFEGGESGLVETPEEKPKRQRRPRKQDDDSERPQAEDAPTPDAAE